MNRAKNWLGFTSLFGVAMTACFAALIPLPSLRGPYVVPFLAYFTLASLGYTLAALCLERDRPPLWVIWGFALLYRLILLTTYPTLSDDIYRYIWDGHLINQGVNPYTYPVGAPALDAYAIPQRELVNHNWMASPYLPAAQLLFALVYRVAPGSALVFQVVATILDLFIGWLVMDLLGWLGSPRRRVLIYLWNPLVVVEFAHGAHVDVWMISLVILSFWFLARAHPSNAHRERLYTASAITLAAATLTKGLPVILVPLFLRRWGWRRSLLYAALVAGIGALFACGASWGLVGPMDGSGLFGALRIYLRQWNYNSSLYHWLEVYLSGYQTPGAVPLEPAYQGAIRLAKLITTTLLGLITLGTGLRAWRLDNPEEGNHNQRTLALLRLAALPIGAYLLLTTTVHPWYATFIMPFIPFLLPVEEESSNLSRFIWPWLYFSCALAFSYVAYIDPTEFHEFSLVRQLEYLPFYLLLLWAVWPFIHRQLNQISVRGIF